MADIIIRSATGYPHRLKDMGDGTFAEVVYVLGAGGGGGGGSSVPPVLAVIDSATPAKRWVMVTDYSATPATVTFYEFGTTTLGTPTLPVMPDADTSVAVSNFPVTQAVTGPLTADQLATAALATETTAQAIRDRLPATPNSRGSGNVDATTQRVVLASDGPTVTAIGAQNNTAAAADGTGDYSIISALKRGLLNWATLLARIPALVSNRLPVMSSIPSVTSATNLSVTTAATGATYTSFSSQACTALDIVNNSGTTIEYRRGGAGVAVQIPTGAARMVIGITNANQIDVRRTDTSNAQVTVTAEAFVA